MTLCMVNTFRYRRGGDSAYALNLESALRARGVDVASFAMQHPESLPSSDEADFAPEVDYPRLQREGGLGAGLEVLRRAIYNREARQALSRLLDRRPCRLAHLHSVMHHLTASVVLELYGRGIPVVWTLHDLKSVCPTTLFLREGEICERCQGGRFHHALLTRCKRGSLGASAIVTAELYLHRWWKVYERADLLLAPSRFLRDKVLESGLRPRRIEVLPNPVDTSFRAPSPDDAGYVLYVGRVSREKGLRTLVDACARSKIPLRIAGTGEEVEPLRDLVAQRSLDWIQLEGYCTGERLESLYRGARLVAIPSECYENCPMVGLEAFAWGKPVLGSSIGGLVEMIDDRGVGELVSAGEVEAWSAALERWMSDPAACRAAGRAGRALAESAYSPAHHLDRLTGYYEELAPDLLQKRAEPTR